MAPTKVFAGNLSFKTGEAELAQEFSAAGKVLTANIIARGPRSLGYGFVEMESEEEANKAVELLNKKEIDGRQINVEVARPRADRPEGEAPRRGSFRGGRGGRGRGEGGSGRGRGGRGRGGRGGARAEGGEQRTQEQGAATTEGGEVAAEGGERRRRGGRGRGSRGGNRGGARGAGAPAGAGGAGRGRGGIRRADEGAREESETTLFVANLPFSVTDEQLKAEFGAGGFAVKAAHVVTRVTGRSKGYGFVDYESKSDQTRALAAFESKEIEGRALIVKIALKDNRPAEGESDSPAATAAQPNTVVPTEGAPAQQ